MHAYARIRIAASFLAISAAAACGSDSTGPRPPSAAQLAAHFDSIAIAASAQSETNDIYESRVLISTLIEAAAALGAVPSTVNVTTASGVEQWKAYELLVLSAPGAADSAFALLAFRDADAHTALFIAFDNTGSPQIGGIVTGDTIFVDPTDGSATTSLTSISSTCTTPDASLLNPELGTQTVSACNLASFRTTLALTSSTTVGMDAALTSLSFTNASVNGVRGVAQAPGAPVRRLKTLLRAAAANKRH
jgi:hypothetical protein